jgi:putative intracellular protease/amidase
MRVRLLVFGAVVLLTFVGGARASEPVRGLVLLAHNFGANSYIMRDKLEEFGWELTLTGLTETVQPCPSYAVPMGAQPLTVDVLIQDIQDLDDYDCLIIASASVFAGNPFSDILASQEALDLVRSAVQESLAVAAWCAGVRVLAAADVIDGRNVTGHPNYQAEYEAAGATYLGSGIPPVTDGTIVTGTRGQYYNIQNCDAVAAVIARDLEGGER